MKPNSMENSYNYYKRVLRLSATLLSISLIFATALGMYNHFESFVSKQANVLQAERDYVEIRTDQFTTRLKMFANLHEESESRHYYNRNFYTQFITEIIKNNGVMFKSPFTSELPYIFLYAPTPGVSANSLFETFNLMEDFTPAVAIRTRELNKTLDNFVYTRDMQFLAFLSPDDSEIKHVLNSYPVAEIIRSQTESTEEVLKKYDLAYLKKNRVIWVPPHKELLTGKLATYYAVPIFSHDQITEVVVVRVTSANFNYFFVNPDRPTGFFVTAKDRQIVFGLHGAEFTSTEHKWADNLKTMNNFTPPQKGEVKLGWSNGIFYLSQLVNNSEWMAVYAFDWKTVVGALYSSCIPLLLITIFIISLIWWSIAFFDKSVLIPFYRKSTALYESEIFNRTVVATAPVGLSVVSQRDGSIIFENDNAADLLDQARVDHAQFYQQVLREYDENISALEPASFEKAIPQTDGPSVEMDITVSRARYLHRDVLLFSLVDIGKRKETERLLIDAKVSANQANNAKTMFVANVSHEIRTPLHGALGNLELLELEVNDPAARARINIINHSLNSLLSIVNRILDLTRIEAEELHLHNQAFDLVETIEQCAQTYAPLIGKKGVRFYFIMEFIPENLLIGDNQRISQIVINLLSNAYKFTDSGVIILRIRKPTTGDDNRVCIEIADSGSGIPDDAQAHIFDPFVQNLSNNPSYTEGTGLGLSLCKHLTELMNGEIQLESEAGIGSVFTVSIPLPASTMPVSRLGMFAMLKDKTVTLYADMPGWQSSLQLLLSCYGIHVRLVDSPDALLTDDNDAVHVIAKSFIHTELPAALKERDEQVLLITPDGPLYAQREGHQVKVSAFSVLGILNGLASCFGIVPNASATAAREVMEDYMSLSILVAEDDPVNRMLIQQQLSVLGLHQVSYVENGQEALTLSGQHKFDLLITDLFMPIMGGEALLTHLRAAGHTFPVIVTTATLIKQGEFDAVLHKPVGLEQLKAALLGVLKRQILPQALTEHRMPKITDDIIRTEFIKSWAADRDTLDSVVTTPDNQALRDTLHRLKGALLVLGLRDEAGRCQALHEDCEKLNTAEKQQTWRVIRELIENKIEQWQA